MYSGASETLARGGESAPEGPKTYRVIAFGAHPDDCELEVGGTAARWAKLGFAVKFVSLTNGDVGHHEMAGAFLARRREAEVKKAAEILGVSTQVLDNHDAELMPTLENRRAVTRLIRDWKADVVNAPRPNDYHPHHRYTGVLVQDAAYMVTVPSFCPDVPALADNPVFLYVHDSFQKPNPFSPDVVVPIDTVMDQKFQALDAIESQFYEWLPWIGHYLNEVPKDKETRKAWFKERVNARYAPIADQYRARLVDLLGPDRGKAVKFAEAFEVCEYGRSPSKDELLRIFPFFGEAKAK
jgi:LmbE family N-acetylglucosaminyl deacetylase